VRRHDDRGVQHEYIVKSHNKLMRMCIIVCELRMATIIVTHDANNIYRMVVGGEVGRPTTRELSQTSLSLE
jgi:hypothetical protein